MTGSSLCPDDSGVNCEPACIYTSGRSSILPSAHWTFDGDNWQVSEQTQYSLSPGAGLRYDTQTRLNGTSRNSGSLYLDGSEKASANAEVNLSTKNGFTWSVWISLEQKWKSLVASRSDGGSNDVVWPILSTYENGGDECNGFRLEIRQNAKPLSLELVFLQSAQGDGGCVTNEKVVLPLEQPSWAWRAGIWHHIAVTFSPSINGTYARLYWDEHSVAFEKFTAAVSVENQELYVGANRSSSGFRGYIDELALFDKVMEPSEIAAYALHTTTIEGPGGCRWRATEQRDDAVDAGVSTIETVQGGEQQLEATIYDEDWGGGLLSAWLGGSNRLSGYSQVKLHAKIPETKTYNGDVEFTLHAGDDTCTWYVDSTSAAELEWYTIDLDNPMYCQTNPRLNCAFPLDAVEWASIGSPSEHPVSKVTEARYAIDQILLVPRDSEPPLREIGGKWGPNNWCWRTEAFQVALNAKAQWQDGDPLSVGLSLSGDLMATPALVADLGDHTIDLAPIDNTARRLEISYSRTESYNLDLTLQDRTGSWAQWQIQGDIIELKNPNTTSTTSGAAKDSNDYEFRPWARFPDFDWKAVSYIKIQRRWGSTVTQPIPVTVSSMVVARP